jgi:hypothetical protein
MIAASHQISEEEEAVGFRIARIFVFKSSRKVNSMPPSGMV